MNSHDHRSEDPATVQFRPNDMNSISQRCSKCQMELTAGARFCLNCGQPATIRSPADEAHLIHLATAAPLPLVEKVRAASNLAGERRLVTALFVDVVGSTALTEQLGPTGWSKIMNKMCDWFCPVIYRYEGTIARFVDDELLAFFGAPVAHEDDPVRAVHAALEILDTVHKHAADFHQEFAVDLGVRISLSTGPVTIGPVSSDLHYEYSALGGEINLVAQLEATKRPMTVLVSENTYRLVAPFFNGEDLGEMVVKGQTDAVHIYRINGVRAESEQARGLTGLESPMVGRDSELETLLHLTETVVAGLGRALLIVGESGLGKSRLIAEWKTAVSEISPQSQLHWAEGHCLSYGQDLAYYLLRDLLRSLIGVSATAGEPETRAALYELTRELFGDLTLDVYPYLGHLLSLTLEDEALERVQSLDPPALQAQYQVACKRLLSALAARTSLVLILEDLQWADPSSIETLSELLPLAATTSLLICLVTRPHSNTPGWKLITSGREAMGERFTELTLKSLSENDSHQLVSNLMPIETLPEQARDIILEKAEGNPFFVEEVIRMMIDQGTIQRQNERWIARAGIKRTGIPDNLQGLLLARIDRLPEEAKHTLRVASVIGRRFPARVLEQVVGHNYGGMTLVNQLGQLESIGLIHVSQVKPELAYRFHHTLLQDAAYDSLLPADRCRLHLAVGKAMESLYPDKVEQIAPQLAHHFSEAGDNQCALKYFSLAGDMALKACANLEAESRFRQALELTPSQSNRADLLFKLGQALYWQSRFQDAIQVWRQGIDLYQALEDSDGLAQLFARSARAVWNAGDTPGGLKLCQEGLAAVAGAAESPGLALLMHEAARAYLFNGLPDKARPFCQQALEIAECLGDITVQAEALATLGLLSDQPPEAALAALSKAAELADSANLLSQAARAHINLAALMATMMPNFQAARDHYKRGAELHRLRGSAAGELLGLGGMVGVMLDLGEFAEVEATLPVMRQLLNELPNPGPAAFHIRISEGLLRRYQGELAEAILLLEALQSEERQRGNLQNLVDVDCCLAEVLLASYTWPEMAGVSELPAAETMLMEAIEICDQWSATGVRPRCLLSMVYSCQEQFVDAHRLLSAAQKSIDSQRTMLDEGWSLLAKARLAAAEGRWPEALAAFEATAGAFARMGMRWWRAHVLQERAEVYICRREPTDLEEARTLLQEASSLFADTGASTYTKLIKDRLQTLEVESYAQALDHQQVTQEMVEARKIQTGFLPAKLPRIPGWQLAAALEPSRQTSGDFYDFISLPDGRLGIVIADVADKGAAAALFMALCSSLIRTYAAEYETQPELVLGETNRRILTDTHTDLFVTVFYAILDPATGELVYTNAGHNPPYHFQRDQGAVHPLMRTGLPVGIFEESTWATKTIKMAPGDILVLYTDGVTDALDKQEAFFSVERLLATVKSNLGGKAQEIQKAVFLAIHQFAGSVPQFDDITLIVLVRDASE